MNKPMKVKLSVAMDVLLRFIDRHGWRRGIARAYTTRALKNRGLITPTANGGWAVTPLGHWVAMYEEQLEECNGLLLLFNDALEARDERGARIYLQTCKAGLELLTNIQGQIDEHDGGQS